MSDERQKILTAALNEFAEAGLAEASLETVAARAKLPAGAVRAPCLSIRKRCCANFWRKRQSPWSTQ